MVFETLFQPQTKMNERMNNVFKYTFLYIGEVRCKPTIGLRCVLRLVKM